MNGEGTDDAKAAANQHLMQLHHQSKPVKRHDAEQSGLTNKTETAKLPVPIAATEKKMPVDRAPTEATEAMPMTPREAIEKKMPVITHIGDTDEKIPAGNPVRATDTAEKINKANQYNPSMQNNKKSQIKLVLAMAVMALLICCPTGRAEVQAPAVTATEAAAAKTTTEPIKASTKKRKLMNTGEDQSGMPTETARTFEKAETVRQTTTAVKSTVDWQQSTKLQPPHRPEAHRQASQPMKGQRDKTTAVGSSSPENGSDQANIKLKKSEKLKTERSPVYWSNIGQCLLVTCCPASRANDVSSQVPIEVEHEATGPASPVPVLPEIPAIQTEDNVSEQGVYRLAPDVPPKPASVRTSVHGSNGSSQYVTERGSPLSPATIPSPEANNSVNPIQPLTPGDSSQHWSSAQAMHWLVWIIYGIKIIQQVMIFCDCDWPYLTKRRNGAQRAQRAQRHETEGCQMIKLRQVEAEIASSEAPLAASAATATSAAPEANTSQLSNRSRKDSSSTTRFWKTPMPRVSACATLLAPVGMILARSIRPVTSAATSLLMWSCILNKALFWNRKASLLVQLPAYKASPGRTTFSEESQTMPEPHLCICVMIQVILLQLLALKPDD